MRWSVVHGLPVASRHEAPYQTLEARDYRIFSKAKGFHLTVTSHTDGVVAVPAILATARFCTHRTRWCLPRARMKKFGLTRERYGTSPRAS